MIRALFDANVLITYALFPLEDRPISQALRLGMENTFELSICDRTISEVTEAVERKEYLARKVEAHVVDELLTALASGGHIVPTSDRPSPIASRDSDDDYLLAHAYHHKIDFIVTGDKDLLSLDSPAGIHIVTPREFVILLTLDD